MHRRADILDIVSAWNILIYSGISMFLISLSVIYDLHDTKG